MIFLWLLQYILLPVVIIIFNQIFEKNDERPYQMIKSSWYIYYALFTVLNFIGVKSDVSSEVVGFTVALALFEGLPGLIKCRPAK